LSWIDPADSDYAKVQITFSPTAGSVTQPIEVAKGICSCVVPGLTNNTEYTFTVRSIDTSGNASNGVSVSCTPVIPIYSAEVSGLVAVPGNAQMTLNWTEPGNSDFAKVRISFTPVVAGISQPIEVLKGTSTLNLTPMTEGRGYIFTVKCVNTGGIESVGVSVLKALPLIYTVGVYQNGSFASACYWAGAQQVVLETTVESAATCIYAANGIVYVGGYYKTGSVKNACYWKNGTRTLLDSGAVVNAITVSNGIVYTAGFHNEVSPMPCYWTDTARSELSYSGYTSGQAVGIYVDNGTVYTTGSCILSFVQTGCYWTGSSHTELPLNGATTTVGVGILVQSGVVYIAGGYGLGSSVLPCYWVGTGQNNPTASGAQFSCCMDIALSSGSVYTVGVLSTGTNSQPAFWQDTTRLTLSDRGLPFGLACGIASFNGEIYVCGLFSSSGPNISGTSYWNGTTRVDYTVSGIIPTSGGMHFQYLLIE
jgi:hypothetical protein